MTINQELGQSRLDSLYVIADPLFDTLDSALNDLEDLFDKNALKQEQNDELSLGKTEQSCERN